MTDLSQEMTFRPHSSFVTRIVLPLFTAFLAALVFAYTAYRDSLSDMRSTYETRVEHEADVKRMEQVHGEQMQHLDENLDRIQVTQDKILDRLERL